MWAKKIGGNFVLPSQRTQGGCAELAFQGCGVSPLVWCTVYTEWISVNTKKRTVGLRYDQKSAFHSAGERYIPPPPNPNPVLRKTTGGWGNRRYSIKLDNTTSAQQFPIEFTEWFHQWDPVHNIRDLLEMSEEQKQKYK